MPLANRQELQKILSRFSRESLLAILSHLKFEVPQGTRDAAIKSFVKQNLEGARFIGRLYQQLAGVSVNLAVEQLYLHDAALGPVVREAANKPDLVRRLILADRADALDSVSSFVRFAKKRTVSPLLFEAKVPARVESGYLESRVRSAVDQLNPGRPRPILLDRVKVDPEGGTITIALWREGGKRHVRQLPTRARAGLPSEHDDYPLRPHVIEVDLRGQRIRTTFQSSDRDGTNILHTVTGSFLKYSALPTRAGFLSNPFDAVAEAKIANRRKELAKTLEESDPRLGLLNLLGSAKKSMVTFFVLRTQGNPKKLEIRADDVSLALDALGANPDVLKTAGSYEYELKLDDNRLVRVTPTKVALTGDFSAVERAAVESLFSE